MRIRNWGFIIFMGILVLSIIISIGIGVYTFIKFYDKFNNSAWICVSQECEEYSTGNEWVSQNCNFDSTVNSMMCEFQYQGQDFRLPLTGINIDDMVSCKKYKCSNEVLVSTKLNQGG